MDLTLGLPSTLLLETNWYTCQRVNYSVLIEVEPVQESSRVLGKRKSMNGPNLLFHFKNRGT